MENLKTKKENVCKKFENNNWILRTYHGLKMKLWEK